MWNQPPSNDTATPAPTRTGERLARAAGVILTTLVSGFLTALASGCGGSDAGDQPQLPAIPAFPSQDAPTPPPFLPSDWQTRAIDAANAALNACAQVNTLNPAGCPQQAATDGYSPLAVRWTLLDGSLTHAVALASTQLSDGATPGVVDVYGRYRMSVSYTLPGQGVRPRIDYSGGLAQATMAWDGTSFQNVRFSSYGTPQLPGGATVAPFARPAQAADAAALAAVRAGFQDCVTLPFALTDTTIPDCPQRVGGLQHATSGRWVLNSDPMQGALVSFDTEHGNVAVTGSFDMNCVFVTPPEGPDHSTSYVQRSAAHYTATLTWDGKALTLANIAAV